MKVALVIGSLESGGAEKQLILLAKGLLNSGHLVQVVTLTRTKCGTRRTYFPCADCLSVSPIEKQKRGFVTRVFQLLDFSFEFFKFLKRKHPDVVHAWLPHACTISMPLAFLAGIGVRVSARRGLWSSVQRSYLLPILKISNLFATRFTANSQAVLNDALIVEGIPEDKISLIRNIVDPVKDRAKVEVQPPKAVVVANLISYKGHLDLLNALSLLKLDLKVLMIGDGPLKTELQSKAESLGISSNIDFLGYQSDVISIMRECQFGILPSHSEGLPNFILEAQSIGLPIIATRVGGIPEIVHDSFNGLLVDAKSPAKLAMAINKMADSPTTRIQMSDNCCRNLRMFSEELIVQEYVRLYSGLENNL